MAMALKAAGHDRLVWSCVGVIEAPTDRVADLVLRVCPGPTGPANAMLLHRDRPGDQIVLEGGPTHFTGRLARLTPAPQTGGDRAAPASETGDDAGPGPGPGRQRRDDRPLIQVDLDLARRGMTVTGQWWFRGEYLLTPHPAGTQLSYAALNQSRLPAALIRIWQRDLRQRQTQRLTQALTLIGRQLGCAAYPQVQN